MTETLLPDQPLPQTPKDRPLKADTSLSLGENKFLHVGKVLGRGGYAVVHSATFEHDRRFTDVAAKFVMPQSFSGDFVPSSDAMREAQIHALVGNNPNTLPLVFYQLIADAGGFTFENGLLIPPEGVPTLVTMLVNGGTLQQRLNQGMSPSALVEAVVQLSRALGAAHRQGVIHRDIKPANLLSHEGQWFLSDFGTANFNPTAELILKGSPAYIAPERAAGEPNSFAGDQYSAAVLTGRGLLGEHPHGKKETSEEMLKAHMHEKPRRWKEVVSDRRKLRRIRPMEPVVRQAMARDPSDRYPTIGAYATALQGANKEGAKDAEKERTVIPVGWEQKTEEVTADLAQVTQDIIPEDDTVRLEVGSDVDPTVSIAASDERGDEPTVDYARRRGSDVRRHRRHSVLFGHKVAKRVVAGVTAAAAAVTAFLAFALPPKGDSPTPKHHETGISHVLQEAEGRESGISSIIGQIIADPGQKRSVHPVSPKPSAEPHITTSPTTDIPSDLPSTPPPPTETPPAPTPETPPVPDTPPLPDQPPSDPGPEPSPPPSPEVPVPDGESSPTDSQNQT